MCVVSVKARWGGRKASPGAMHRVGAIRRASRGKFGSRKNRFGRIVSQRGERCCGSGKPIGGCLYPRRKHSSLCTRVRGSIQLHFAKWPSYSGERSEFEKHRIGYF